MAILSLGSAVVEDRMLAGEPTWVKPFKFPVSFAALFATLGFAAGRLYGRWGQRRLIVAVAAGSAAAFLLEMTCISARAARQDAPHVNEKTPFHAMMCALIGHGVTVLMASVAVVGLVVRADRGPVSHRACDRVSVWGSC